MSRSVSAPAEPVHHRLLVLRPHAPVQQIHAEVREDLGRQALGLGLGRLHLRPVPFVDRRADHEALPAGAHLRAHQVVRALAVLRSAHRPRLDGLTALRHLVEHDHVEVAVVGERQGPRDRGRGHDQDVGLDALALQGHPLVQAEPMLLVDDRERQVVERHALLHQRVGPDRQVDRTVGDPLHDARAVLPGDRPGQQRVRHRCLWRPGGRRIQQRGLSVVLRPASRARSRYAIAPTPSSNAATDRRCWPASTSVGAMIAAW